jgi:hypothetical protein
MPAARGRESWGVFGVGAWLAIGLLGCGARAALDAGDPSLDEPAGRAGSGTSAPEVPSGSGGSGGSSAVELPPPQRLEFDSATLAPCELGFRARSRNDRVCTYRVAGRCYTEVEAACACSCPRDGGRTVCAASGFLSEPGEPQDVICFSL